MKTIDEYVTALTGIRKERISTVVDYIREKYPHTAETLDFSPKIKFPTFKQGEVYVSVTNMKNYISIHFGRHEAVKIISQNNPKIKAGVGCVNFRDKDSFPLSDIQNAIDHCFGTV